MEETKIEQPNSCEIAINAKGQWSGKVKVYKETIEAAKEAALFQAEDLAKTIKEKNNGLSN